MPKLADYKRDREHARLSEPILENWYRTLSWIGHFWREPDGTLQQRRGVDVSFINPDGDPESTVFTIDEKVSRTQRNYITFEVFQDTDRPGWGLTAINDFIVFMTPLTAGGHQVWWIDMEGLRDAAKQRPVYPLDFTYADYVRHTQVKYIDLEWLVQTGVAKGPFILEE